MSTHNKWVKAKKRHRCDANGCVIEPGDLYYESTASPGHDRLGNVMWRRTAECESCAVARGCLIPPPDKDR